MIVAAADRLGAINHTLLTVRDLQRIGMQEVSVAMMQSGAEASGPRDNAAVVREWLRPTPVIAVPWLAETPLRRPVCDWVKKNLRKLLHASRDPLECSQLQRE